MIIAHTVWSLTLNNMTTFFINDLKIIIVIILDVDECRENRHNCSNLEECQNTVGGFHCNCKPGYQRNNTTGNCEGRDSNVYSVTVWIICLYLKLIIGTQSIYWPISSTQSSKIPHFVKFKRLYYFNIKNIDQYPQRHLTFHIV